MMLYTGEKGKTLKEIIELLGSKNYPFIECRCLYVGHDGEENDDFFGACEYFDGALSPLDGDSYSLEDKYIKWEEFTNSKGHTCLTVWESGHLEEG